jgi:hypothetical protein
MKIRPAVAEFSHADGQIYRQHEADIGFRNFSKAPKMKVKIK